MPFANPLGDSSPDAGPESLREPPRLFKFRSAPLLALSASLALSACVPDLGPKPQPRSAASLASIRTLPDEQGAWPGDGWWKRYGDAQLDQLITEGLAGSPDIATAAARLARAEGLARREGAVPRPQLGLSASGTRIDEPSHHSSTKCKTSTCGCSPRSIPSSPM